MKAILGALLVALTVTPALAGEGDVVKGELGEKLDRTVQVTSKGGFWGTVLVAKGGETLLAKGYGNADYRARPNSPRTLYEIASVSKMFTAAAVLKLEAQGKLKTSDGLAKFFDKVPDDKKGITVLQLLAHTSGISPELGLPYDAEETRDQLVAYVLEKELASKPDEKFEYCNVGYALLAAIVEKASGQSFEQYVKEQVFAPAGMKDTAFLNDKDLDRSRAALRLRESELDRSAAEWSWSWGYRGMGGVVTTAEDLLKYDRALRANQVLDAETQKKQTTPVQEVSACGCFVEKTFRGTRKVYHTGGVAGFSSLFARYVEDDVVIVILSNENADTPGLETALVNAIFPPPTATLSLELGASPPEGGVLLMKEGTTWKGERSESGVVLRVRSGEKTPAKVACSLESAKALLSMLQDALEARAREKVAEADGPAQEADLFFTPYDLEEGKLELPKLGIKVLPKYVTERENEKVEDRRITLVLVDEAQAFWPLLVKMNTTSAKALTKELEAALSPK